MNARACTAVFFLMACFAFASEPAASPEIDGNLDIADIPDEGNTLYDLPVLESEGLTIVASVPMTTQTKTVTKQEIENLNPADLIELLQKSCGLSITRNGGYGNASSISLRGFSSGRVTILVDGVPVNSALSGDFDLTSINVNSIEKAEVTYGSPVGGTVNIVTVKKNNEGISLDAGISNMSQLPSGKPVDMLDAQNVNFSLSAGSQKSNWKLDWFANRAGNHYRYIDFFEREKRREDNEILDAGASTSASFFLTDLTKLAASISLYAGDKEISGTVLAKSPGKQKDFSTRETVFLDVNRFYSDKADTELTVTHSYSHLGWTTPYETSRHDLNGITAGNTWGYEVTQDFKLKADAGMRWSWLDSSNTGRISAGDGSVQSSAEFNSGKNFLFAPSLDLVIFDQKITPVPKIGLGWFFANGVTVRTNIFRMYKLPDFEDLYWCSDATAKGNPDLVPEDGLGGDIVLSQTKEGLYAIEASAYSSWYENAIVWQSKNNAWMPDNIGKAFCAGADLSAKSDFSDRVSLVLAYSFLETRVLTGDYAFADRKRIPYQPMHRASGTFSFSVANLYFEFSPQFQGSRYTTIANVGELPAFFTLDASATLSAGHGMKLYASGKNLTRSSYSLVDGYPMPEMTVTVGAKYSYR